MFGNKRDHSIFGTVPFTAEEQQRTDAYLRQKLNSNFLSRRPGPGGRRLTYLESCKAIEIANEAFGFNGWSCRIVDCNIECKERSDDGRWSIIYSSVVRIELKDGACHEDVGFGQSDGLKDLGAALEQAKKASISDARKRALRLFGEYLGNSCYDKEHIKDVAANRANNATLQSPTSIKLENAQTAAPSSTTPPLHPPRAIEAPPSNGNAPGFQFPPQSKQTPAPAPAGIVQNRPQPVNNKAQSPPRTMTASNPSNPSIPQRTLPNTNQAASHASPRLPLPAPAPAPPSPQIKVEPNRAPHGMHSYQKPSFSNKENNPHRDFTSGAPSNTTPAPYMPNGQGPIPGAVSSSTFVRPMPTNQSPSMSFHQESMMHKRPLPVAAHDDDLEGLRMSQFDFDDSNDAKRFKA